MKNVRVAPAMRYLLLGLALFVGVGGCTADGNVVGPENQLEVSNIPDTFQWQVSALSAVTQTFTYTWVNSGTTASVNQASSLVSGSADLRITDSAGTEVYSRSLASNGTFQTGPGTAGNWTVTVTLSKANGTLNFRLQKP